MNTEIFQFQDHSKEIPTFKEPMDNKNNYYKLGPDNRYYDYLQDLYKSSSNHSSMVDNIIQRITGTGFQSEIPEQQELIEKYKLNEWLNISAKNLVLYGGFSTEIIWDMIHEKINSFYGTQLDKVRVGLIDIEGGEEDPTLYYYSDYFSEYTYGSRNKYIDILYKFDTEPGTDAHQMMYNYGVNRVGNDIYPRSDYSSGSAWIHCDIQIPLYYMNLLYNNFMVSGILVVPFQPSEDDRMEFEKGIKEKFVGVENSSSTMVVYAPSGDGTNEVKYLNITGDQGERKYDELLSMTAESIARAHGIPSPMLAGISLPGNLFGISDLPTLETMFNKQNIYPKRQLILQEFNKINEYLRTPITNFDIGDINVFDEKTV